MDKIKKFNLELILFHKELTSYIQNVNKIDDETDQLMIKIVLAVDKLQINSQFREIPSFNENQFAYNLNDEIFQSRRYIVCRLCHEQIPSNPEDFEAHIQKRSHKEAESEVKLTRLNTKRSSPEILKDSTTTDHCVDIKFPNSINNNVLINGKGSESQVIDNFPLKPNTNGNIIGPSVFNKRSINEIEMTMKLLAIQSAKKLSANHLSCSNLSLASVDSVKSTLSLQESIGLKAVIGSIENTISPKPSSSKKLENIIKTENKPTLNIEPTQLTKTVELNSEQQLFYLIEKEILDMRCQSALDLEYESEIISVLSKYIHQFKPSLHVTPFGSRQYGFKRSKTNFNLLVDTGGEKPKEIGQRFFFKIDKTDIFLHFKVIHKIGADRVLHWQYSLTHTKSGIQCLVLFDSDSSVVKSADIISKYVNEPMCRFLISYISAWQTVLNREGKPLFEFNTYIISVLVIFFLQMNYKLPTVDKIESLSSNLSPNITNFKAVVRQFFEFYGNKYQMYDHIISANIGRWQEKQVQPSQKHFSEAQQRLRQGIETSPENWTDCTMCVQDLVRPNINITAEIPQHAAENFRKMCQKFAKIAPK